jgi:hypothetical protein
MDDSSGRQLPRGCLDRLVYGVVTLLALALFLSGLVVVFLEWKPDGVGGSILKAMACECLLLINTMLGLSVLWCLFTPAWVERALARRERWFKAIAVLIVVSGILAIVVLSLVTPR